MDKDILYKKWRMDKKGNLVQEISKIISGRDGYTCDHCERQYDDGICDQCLARLLVEKFERTISEVTK